MRLAVLENGHRLRARVAMRLIALAVRTDLDDVARTSLYRPGLFGRPWLALIREVMLGPSSWSRGEREILAAFVSHRNRCRYCVGIHTRTATLISGREISPDLLDAWRSAGFDPRIQAAFALLDALGRDPEAPPDEAVASARAAGLSTEAVADVLAVAFAFDLVNRLADAFDYSYGDEDGRLAQAEALVRLAYRVPSFLLA